MPTTRQWEIQCFSATTLSFPDFLSAQNMVRIIGSKIVYWKWSESIWEKPKITPRVAGDLAAIFRRERSDDRKCVCCSQATGDSGYRGFELPRVKITVNVWRKSRGNRFWFELAGLDCTVNMTNINFRSFHYFFCRRSWAEKNNEDTTILTFLSLSRIYFYWTFSVCCVSIIFRSHPVFK